MIEDEKRWILKAQKNPIGNFFLRETENEEDEGKMKRRRKNEWKIEAKKKRTRKKIKSPYDAIYTSRMCNVFD